MRVATQSLISAQVANGGGAPVVELLLCQESGFCQFSYTLRQICFVLSEGLVIEKIQQIIDIRAKSTFLTQEKLNYRSPPPPLVT